MNKEQLQEIITAANFDSLIGQIENDWFDCKGEPYQIQNESGKRELAKDVSSFANHEGGFIFIGIKTRQSTEHSGDEVESLRPFIQNLVNTSQYRDIVRSWVYPEVEGIDVSWIEITAQPCKGLVIISVPKQKEPLKPFLITKTLDGGRKIETIFGYVQRRGDSNQPYSVSDLQKVMHSGLHYEEQLKERLDGVEVLLKNTIHQNQTENQKKTDDEKINQRIERTLEHDDLKKKRVIVISAYPNQVSNLKTIFLSTAGSIKRSLENPPILRLHGWSLETRDQARIMRGEMIRVTNGNRKVIDLYKDGTLVFTGLADHSFLAWHDEDKQKINPLAVVEVVYDFLLFYKLVLEDMEQQPANFTMRIDFKNLYQGEIKSYLVPYALNTSDQMFELDKRDAPDDTGTIIKVFDTAVFDPTAIGYEMVKEIYLWFGLEEDKIPYVKTEGDLKLIDTQIIRGQQ